MTTTARSATRYPTRWRRPPGGGARGGSSRRPRRASWTWAPAPARSPARRRARVPGDGARPLRGMLDGRARRPMSAVAISFVVGRAEAAAAWAVRCRDRAPPRLDAARSGRRAVAPGARSSSPAAASSCSRGRGGATVPLDRVRDAALVAVRRAMGTPRSSRAVSGRASCGPSARGAHAGAIRRRRARGRVARGAARAAPRRRVGGGTRRSAMAARPADGCPRYAIVAEARASGSPADPDIRPVRERRPRRRRHQPADGGGHPLSLVRSRGSR